MTRNPWRVLLSALVVLSVTSSADARRSKRPASRKPAPVTTPATTLPAPACEEPKAPPALERIRVMLLDLEAEEAQRETAGALGQVVAEEAAKVTGFELLSSAEVRAVLDQEAAKALMGCDDNSCLAELADAMDATLLVSGALAATPEGARVLTLSLLNTRALVTVNRVSLSWSGDEARLPDLARAATQLLVFEREQRAPATVVLEHVPTGARVLVDGADRSADAARGRIKGLEVGVREISISAPGFTPRTERVLLVAGQTLSVDGALVEVPVTDNWWFWTGAGAAVLAGVGVTAAVVALAGPADVTVSAQLPQLGQGDVERVKGARR